MDPFQLMDPLDICLYCAYQCLAYNTTELAPLFGSYMYYGPSCYSNCTVTVTKCVFLCVLIKMANIILLVLFYILCSTVLVLFLAYKGL